MPAQASEVDRVAIGRSTFPFRPTVGIRGTGLEVRFESDPVLRAHLGSMVRICPRAASERKFLARSSKSCAQGKTTTTRTAPDTWANDRGRLCANLKPSVARDCGERSRCR